MSTLVFFLQLEVLVLPEPHLALAVLVPFTFGTVSSSTAAPITTSTTVLPGFGLLCETSIGTGGIGVSLGKGQVSLHKVPQVLLDGDYHRY